MVNHSELIQRFFKGECSSEELHKVYGLLKSKDFEAEILDYLDREWRDFDEYKHHPTSHTDLDHIYREIKKRNKQPSFFIQTLKVAASIATIFVLSFLVYKTLYTDDNALAYHEVVTQRGETKKVVLSDGTEVLLNADSKIKYPKEISEKNRKIYIEGGAYFKVKDKSTSLEVFVDVVKAIVSGGSFNVSGYPSDDKITIALEEGTMKTILPLTPLRPGIPVEYDEDGNPINLYPAKTSTQKLIINEKEFFSFNKTMHQSILKQYEDPREHFAWVDGTLYFHDVDLKQMLKQLSRRFDVDFDLKGCTDEEKIYSGEYKNQTLQYILSHTTNDMTIQYVETRKKATLTGECNDLIKKQHK